MCLRRMCTRSQRTPRATLTDPSAGAIVRPPSEGFRTLFSMEATFSVERLREEVEPERDRRVRRRVDELACLSAHLSAATARWVELVWELSESGDFDDPLRFVAWRCGVTTREAREFLRVGEALQDLPLIRAAFGRGELTFSKVPGADPGRDAVVGGGSARSRGRSVGGAVGAGVAGVSPGCDRGCAAGA